MDKKANNTKAHFLQRKVIFHFLRQCYIKAYHSVSLPRDSLGMYLPFPVLPMDSLGQSFHHSSVHSVFTCNFTSKKAPTVPVKQKKNQTQTALQAVAITSQKRITHKHYFPSFWWGYKEKEKKKKAFEIQTWG